ncbi:MAG: T9SS type A sorting domain-containing protein [Bacteroidales bacterium]|nr:T9SS type A sorting domain-containing protein [Bacteroidales bacterium]
MRDSLRVFFSVAISVVLIGAVFAGNKKNNIIKEHIYFDKGMRHHLVVMNDESSGLNKTNGAGVIDTITHCDLTGCATWDEGIQSYAGGGAVVDTVTNWYWFAADTAEILEIHASFVTTGTGSWNVWGVHYPAGYAVPNTADSKLLLDVPWTITDADTNTEGVPTGNLQVLDLDAQGLSAFVAHGAYVGEYYDQDFGPKMFMDNGGHPRSDASWNVARMYIASYGGWYFWATATHWTEFVQRIVVHYDKVAPLIENVTAVPDYFVGNTNYPTVEAKVFDLDGTVATSDLVFKVFSNGTENRIAMTNTSGDIYAGDFGMTFASEDTVYYWIEATDDQANFRASASSYFLVIDPPVKGTDIFVINQNGGYESLITDALTSLAKDYYVWDISEHGGISDFEINWGFDNILWYGFGSTMMPSPFETGAHSIKDFLNGGGNLMLIDRDYLYLHGFSDDTLETGEFGYDYLGLYSGISDPGEIDTVYYGIADDPISGAYLEGVDSIVTLPNTYGEWYTTGGYLTDWSDWVLPVDNSEAVLYEAVSNANGYYAAIRHAGSNSKTAYFPLLLETSSNLTAVLDSTFNWFAVSVGIDDGNPTVPDVYALEQNHPNPFNPVTTINFSIAKSAKVELVVYNTLGQKVITLLNEDRTSGLYSVVWNGLNKAGHKVASGIYYYELKSGDFCSIKKMLLVK